ncbi:hypothetical protein BGW80DRAFT_1142831, partial [Lactifluus volemus]
EPGSSLPSCTRIKTLAYDTTILSNARFLWKDIAAVPRMALTVGVKTVLPVGSREAIVVVTGQGKALAKSMGWIIICGHCQHLQMHHLALIVVDEDATA